MILGMGKGSNVRAREHCVQPLDEFQGLLKFHGHGPWSMCEVTLACQKCWISSIYVTCYISFDLGT